MIAKTWKMYNLFSTKIAKFKIGEISTVDDNSCIKNGKKNPKIVGKIERSLPKETEKRKFKKIGKNNVEYRLLA